MPNLQNVKTKSIDMKYYAKSTVKCPIYYPFMI